MNIESVVKGSHITKKFKDFKLDIPALEIPKGFATALIGENGAGKSTLINILAGIRLDYKGELSYFDGTMQEKDIRENIGYTGSGNYFMPHWTINQVGEASKLLFDRFDEEVYKKLLVELDVREPDGKKKDKAISKLSDGMRMKVTLSAVFARQTQLLLLDEPASPLDPLMRDKLCAMIRNYIEEGDGENSVFFSTHNIADMENVTDYAMIMECGQIVEQGFVEDLKEKYILIKGEKEDIKKAEEILYSIQKNSYGFEGICLAENLDKLAGMDISTETPSLAQISVAVMKNFTRLTA
ncbi:MAG: ABC transporter ATP-binding protein [Lachnospiraceae bacterium]|nr:ABC transporter ATP-binding protein [Lachnospiraceae bacterium]